MLEISHITFTVKDLEKSSELLRYVFGAEEAYSSGDAVRSIAREKFFLIGNLWVVLMEGEPLAEKTYNHVALRISEKEMDAFAEKINKMGLEIKVDRKRIPGEGRSLYFYDYDNHLFELHAGTLQERLKAYRRKRE